MSPPEGVKGLHLGLQRLRANGWSGAVKVRARMRTKAELEFIQRGDGGWELYGPVDPKAKWRRSFASLGELDGYLGRIRPKETLLLARAPMLVTGGKMEGAWQIRLCEVA